MKLPDKMKTKKQRMKKKLVTKPKKEKVLVVAQEFKFARLLSGNEKKTRDRVLKTFKKWLLNCFEKKYEFKEEDFIRVWKGLFYAVWMSDKPLVQEELCDSICEILELFPAEQVQHAVLMTAAGLKVLATEWYGIDHHRMDKFLMLVRRYLRGSLRCLARCQWSLDTCRLYADMLARDDGILALTTPHYARNAVSMILHIIDCYLEELSKVSKGNIPDESMTALLYPFTRQVCGGDERIAVACRRLLTALIRQSELGLEYDHVTRAWQKMGCPAGGPDALQLVSDDDDDDDEETTPDGEDAMDLENGNEPLDPRAGRVNVSLTPLPVPARLLAEQLRQLMTTARSKSYKRARICLQRLEELAGDRYPLRIKEEEAGGAEPRVDPAQPQRAAARLRRLERSLLTSSDELALRGLGRKHRKRLLARTRAGLSIVDEAADKTDTTNGEWQVESTEENAENKLANNEVIKHKKKNRKRKLNKDTKQENSKKPKISEESAKINGDAPVALRKKDVSAKKQTNSSKKDKNNVKKVNKDVNSVKKDKVSDNKENQKKKEKDKVKDTNKKDISDDKNKKKMKETKPDVKPTFTVNKVKNYQKQVNGKKESPKKKVKESPISKRKESPKRMDTPKKVKFVLKNNGMQGTVDYYKSVRQSPNIPFDSSKQPVKTNLKPSTPSPINPFFKKKLKKRKNK